MNKKRKELFAPLVLLVILAAFIVFMLISNRPNLPDADHALIGSWLVANEGTISDLVINFNADGTGSRGNATLMEEITWRVRSENEIEITNDRGRPERERFAISGGTMHMAGTSFIRTQDVLGSVANNPDNIDELLAGTWQWTADNRFLYRFRADGTGYRGFPDDEQVFTWIIEGNRSLVLTFYEENFVEFWTLIMDGNLITLDSNQMQEMRFSYERVS